MKKSLLFLLLSIFFFSCQSKLKPAHDIIAVQPATYADSLTNELNEIHKQGHFNGLSVAIVNEGGTLYQSGFGFSDAQAKEAYSVNTIQNIGSVSKTFIGVALMKAQEVGKLNLDDPINAYLPFKVVNSYFPTQPITIRHLATHTSTITDTEEYFNKVYLLKEKRDQNKAHSRNCPKHTPHPEPTALAFIFESSKGI